MNENIYFLSDRQLLLQAGARIKKWRLKQNITQSSLAEMSGISLSSVQKVERGEPVSVIVLVKVLRQLRKLELFNDFIVEEKISPAEYFKMQDKLKERKRASVLKEGK